MNVYADFFPQRTIKDESTKTGQSHTLFNRAFASKTARHLKMIKQRKPMKHSENNNNKTMGGGVSDISSGLKDNLDPFWS